MGQSVRNLLPPDFRLYRSPWFDAKSEERNYDPVAIGQELQIEYLTSGSPRFSVEDMAVAARTVSDPIERRKIEFVDGQMVVRGEQEFGELWIFERPVPGNSYVLAIDPSSGNANRSGKQGSKVVTSQTSLMVLNTAEFPKRAAVAAYFQSRQLDPGWTARLGTMLGHEYNHALMIFEVTGLGQAVLVTLIGSGQKRAMYDRFYYQKRSKPDEKGRDHRVGWWNNTATRPLLEQAIADNLLVVDVRDSRVMEQLQAFVWSYSGSELQGRAQEGYNDDGVITLGLALIGSEQCKGVVNERGEPEKDWSDVLDAHRLGSKKYEDILRDLFDTIRSRKTP